jgi:hypothetical protein
MGFSAGAGCANVVNVCSVSSLRPMCTPYLPISLRQLLDGSAYSLGHA